VGNFERKVFGVKKSDLFLSYVRDLDLLSVTKTLTFDLDKTKAFYHTTHLNEIVFFFFKKNEKCSKLGKKTMHMYATH
jgi:hypothetical protein